MNNEKDITLQKTPNHTWYLATPKARPDSLPYFHHIAHMVTEEISEIITEVCLFISLVGITDTPDQHLPEPLLDVAIRIGAEYGDWVGSLRMLPYYGATDSTFVIPLNPDKCVLEKMVKEKYATDLTEKVTFRDSASRLIGKLAKASKQTSKIGRFGPDEPPYGKPNTGWEELAAANLDAMVEIEVFLKHINFPGSPYASAAPILKRNKAERMMYVAAARNML